MVAYYSENVAAQFGVTREAQDKFAAQSFAKASAAQKAGKFDSEIVPIKTKWSDPKTEQEKDIVVSKDDGIRFVERTVHVFVYTR
jgi:acetyl-CoA acyltransferase 1